VSSSSHTGTALILWSLNNLATFATDSLGLTLLTFLNHDIRGG
jgi:hypothetical protein